VGIIITIFYCVTLAAICAISGVQVLGKESQVEFRKLIWVVRATKILQWCLFVDHNDENNTLLDVTSQVPILLRLFLDFWKICVPLVNTILKSRLYWPRKCTKSQTTPTHIDVFSSITQIYSKL
jgi:hypothetical protein